MNTKPLIWAGTVALVMLSLFLLVSTQHTLGSSTTTNTVSFSGQGKVLAKPDVAVIDLSIVTESPTSKAAQDDNSKKSKAVTDFLKKAGIEEKDIKTTGYNIYPQYDYTSGKSVLRGYQVNQTTQVKVRDLTKVDDVLAGVVSAGANQINQFQLTIDDPDKLKEEARQQAIKDAQDKAKVLQHQLGIRLGHIVNFSEDSVGGVPPIYMKAGALDGRGGAAIAPEVSIGENEVTVTVSITYQIR